MQIHHIASYKFIVLDQLVERQAALRDQCIVLGLKGTILLGKEGINLSLSGEPGAILKFKQYLQQDSCFGEMSYRESFSDEQPFKRLKVKIKKEIITLRSPLACPEMGRAPAISPQEFKKWQDECRDMVVLDTRNDYEVQLGTFNQAVNLHLNEFTEFLKAAEQLPREKPIVMFCTGGIRCEKAALHLLGSGFKEVYQLDGGILNYFKEVGGAHFSGDCFIFDERIALDSNLQKAKLP